MEAGMIGGGRDLVQGCFEEVLRPDIDFEALCRVQDELLAMSRMFFVRFASVRYKVECLQEKL
jgi:hypothetical protein